MENCTFCAILSGKEEGASVYEDDETFAVMDRNPINDGHVLVMPKKHYETLLEMPLDEVGYLFSIVVKVARAVRSATGAHGINIGQNNGRAASQIVPHVHAHVIPRFMHDSPDGRWPSRKRSTMDELVNMAKIIGREIEKAS